jgi:hypothetical protein
VSAVERAAADVDAIAGEHIHMPTYFNQAGVDFDEVMAAAQHYAVEGVKAYNARRDLDEPIHMPTLAAICAAVWARGFAAGRHYARHHEPAADGDGQRQ